MSLRKNKMAKSYSKDIISSDVFTIFFFGGWGLEFKNKQKGNPIV